ncbi:radical SAM protein [Nonomuraea sp. NPDC050556]|uniref:radical SAM protein n=1 Tax=Nonomuraea sp. NPDC050556 TaxID=3364369 RepID=UPI0037A96B76
MSLTITRLDLELTGRCPLQCLHCYADSGPTGGHGVMTASDWLNVLEQGTTLGVTHIQLIGGEPTAYPAFAQILAAALDYGLTVEVFSNLLATSYYSDRADQHDQVTGRAGSHARTRANIAEALARGIPVRAAIVDVQDGQRVQQAIADLKRQGVETIGTDGVRPYGRGTGARAQDDVSKLCGRCGHGKAAISPDGDVWPCVMSRWMVAGNVREEPLADILYGPAWRKLVATVPAPRPGRACNPDCKPSTGDGGDCAPAETETCDPSFCNPDE